MVLYSRAKGGLALPKFDQTETLKRVVFAFWQYGYAECSVKHLEESTGLHVGSLYYHFKNKEQLYYDAVIFYVDDMLIPRLECVSTLDQLQQYFYSLYREPHGTIKNTCFLIQAVSDVSGHTKVNQAFKKEMMRFETALTNKINVLLPSHTEIIPLLMDLHLSLYIYSEQSTRRTALDNKIKQRFKLVKSLCSIN